MNDESHETEAKDFDEAVSAFLEACDDGPAGHALCATVARESARLRFQRRVRRFTLAAAALALAAGLSFPLRPKADSTATDHAALICPHGSSDPGGVLRSGVMSLAELREFLHSPDNFERVCYCRPAYSGSLRDAASIP